MITFINESFTWLNKYSDAFVAIFTCALFISTFFLWLATRRQSKATEQTIELIKNNARAELRPYISIEPPIQIYVLPQENETKALLTRCFIKNVGKSIASDVDVHCFLTIDKEPPALITQKFIKKNFPGVFPAEVRSLSDIGSEKFQKKLFESLAFCEGKIYLHVRIEYSDLYKGKYMTEYSAYLAEGCSLQLARPENFEHWIKCEGLWYLCDINNNAT